MRLKDKLKIRKMRLRKETLIDEWDFARALTKGKQRKQNHQGQEEKEEREEIQKELLETSEYLITGRIDVTHKCNS